MNIIAYRLPNNPKIYIYEVSKAQEINVQSQSHSLKFVVSGFNNTHIFNEYRCFNTLSDIPQTILFQNNLSKSFIEFEKHQYYDYINQIKNFINGSLTNKIVASRRMTVPFSKDINDLFFDLCNIYNDAFIFFLSTEELGTWIGASPELLLERQGSKLTTMSLAGTRSLSCSKSWDKKNIKEQKIVTDYLIDIFDRFRLNPSIINQGTKQAGNIEHLMTIIEGKTVDNFNLISLLKALSPTPALSGFPKKEAIEIINNFEGDRSLYGGFMGPVFPNGDFRFNVILRCACLSPTTATLFAGGGITYLSDPEEEWEETEKKLETIRRLL